MTLEFHVDRFFCLLSLLFLVIKRSFPKTCVLSFAAMLAIFESIVQSFMKKL